MTVSSTARRTGPFAGNGVTTSVPFTFKVFEAADLEVTHTDAAGVETVLTLNTHYSVTLNADQDTSPGGTLTYPVSGDPLPTGETITIIGATAYEQDLDISNAGRFLPQALENALDKTVILVKQLREKVGRALLFSVNDTGTDVTIPQAATRAGLFLAFDASGDPVASSGTGADAGLRADLAAGTGSSLVAVQRTDITSPVSRTVEAALGDIKSVLGATAGAGVAANDTAGIQRVLNLGGLIYVPKPAGGIYYTDDTLVIPSDTHVYVERGTRFKQAASINKPLFANYAYATRPWVDVSAALTWIGAAGWKLEIAWAGHGLAVGDWVWLDSTDQAQYCGCFPVYEVPGANTVRVKLDTQPAGNPTGTVQVKKADVNITVDGLDLDYNFTNNAVAVGFDNHCSIFAGIHNFKARDITGRDTAKFVLCTAALDGFEIDGVKGDGVRSDIVKIYGPAWNGKAINIEGYPGDDLLSLQCREPTAFAEYRLCNGGNVHDIEANVQISHGVDGQAVMTTIYPTDWGAATIDEITLRDYAGHTDGVGVSIYDQEGTGGTVETLRLRNFNARCKNPVYASIHASVTGPLTIRRLDVEFGPNAQCVTGSDFITVGASVNVDELILRGQHIDNSGIGTGVLAQIVGQVRALKFDHLRWKVNASYLVSLQGAAKTLETVNFTNTDIEVTDAMFRAGGVVLSANPVISVAGGTLKTGTNLFEIASDCTLSFNGVQLLPGSKVLLAVGGTAPVIVLDARGTNLASGEWINASTDATISPRSFDITYNLNAAFIKRAAGNCMTTSSGAGTIPAGAACICDETGAANSWHGIANPTVQLF